MFEPDGWSYRARIGLLVPDGDVGPESEFSAMVPAGVGINASRFEFPSSRGAREPGQIGVDPVEMVAAAGPLDAAVKLIAKAPVDAIALAFTSTSYLSGPGEDGTLADRLAGQAAGKPVVTTGAAILAALSQLEAARVWLVDPPWFPADLTAKGRDWLSAVGHDVTASTAGLPTGQANIHPGTLYRWLKANRPQDTDAIVLGGNGFRSAGVVRLLEADTGCAVVTANTALLWATLGRIGLPRAEVTRYGRLFSLA